MVVNLYALRSTTPKALWRPGVDAIGEHNAAFLAFYTSAEVTGGGPVVCAWGANGLKNGRGAAVARQLQAAGVQLCRLDVTATGQPGHPIARRRTVPRLAPLDVAAIGGVRA